MNLPSQPLITPKLVRFMRDGGMSVKKISVALEISVYMVRKMLSESRS